MVKKELLYKILNSYLHPEKGSESKDNPGRKQIALLAKEFKITPSKIRKILITAGYFSNEESKQVQLLYDSGKTIEQIMNITGLGRSSVNSYLPYSKGLYKNEPDNLSIENIRVRKHREKKDSSVSTMSNYKAEELKKHVVFYGVNDLGIAFHLDTVKSTLLNFNPVKSLREAIHVYNCYLYAENKVFGREWSESDKEKITENTKLFKDEVAKYLNSHPNCILVEFLDLEYDYQDCSMRMAAVFNIFRKWDRKQFSSVLTDVMVRSILKVERLVNHFDSELTVFLCKNTSLATEILVDYNSIPLVEVNNKVYLPKQFSDSKKAEVLERYVNSSEPSIGYLLNILTMPHTIKISKNSKSKAERIIDEHWKQNYSVLNQDNNGVILGVRFVPYQEWKSSVIQKPKTDFIMRYPIEVIDQHLTTDGIFYCLNNMFGIFDLQNNQIALTKRRKYYSLVDDLFFTKTRYGYNLQHHQHTQMQYIHMTLSLYYDYLLEHGIQLEQTLGDGFSKILADRYDIESFNFKLPCSSSSFEEKCSSICPKIEGLFDRIYLLEKNETIDHYNLKACPKVHFNLIGSRLSNKYLYVNDEVDAKRTVASISALLFSNVNLFIIDRLQNQTEKPKNNFELFLQNNISFSEIHDWDKDAIGFLIEKKCIVEVNNCLKLTKLTLSLKELWDSGYISTYKTPSEIRVLHSLVSFGWLRSESTLLSRPEQEFMSYIYGSDYPDSIALRNAYAHDDMGGFPEEIHRNNYIWFLFMIIVLEIKLLDEFETVKALKEFSEKQR